MSVEALREKVDFSWPKRIQPPSRPRPRLCLVSDRTHLVKREREQGNKQKSFELPYSKNLQLSGASLFEYLLRTDYALRGTTGKGVYSKSEIGAGGGVNEFELAYVVNHMESIIDDGAGFSIARTWAGEAVGVSKERMTELFPKVTDDREREALYTSLDRVVPYNDPHKIQLVSSYFREPRYTLRNSPRDKSGSYKSMNNNYKRGGIQLSSLDLESPYRLHDQLFLKHAFHAAGGNALDVQATIATARHEGYSEKDIVNLVAYRFYKVFHTLKTVMKEKEIFLADKTFIRGLASS